MKPIVVVPGRKPMIMEVIGEKGQKVGEYDANAKERKLPYHVIEERMTL